MAYLAIKGHANRGKEVIDILEMLGGKNRFHFRGDEHEWFILNRNIQYTNRLLDEKSFTLEEFLEKYPYKVGDKVQRKGAPPCGSAFEVENMRWDEDTVKYTLCLFGCNDIRSVLPAEHLQPYKEVPIYLNEKANKQAEEIAEILEPVKEIMEEMKLGFEFIKRWRERRRRESILRDIKKAKQLYLAGEEHFMCLCFKSVNWDKYTTTEAIQERIPEFNPTFCEATHNDHVWWLSKDRESRIKAFDKLIETYSK